MANFFSVLLEQFYIRYTYKGSLFPGKIGDFEPIMTMMWCICVSDSDASVFHLPAFLVRGCGFGYGPVGGGCGCIRVFAHSIGYFHKAAK